MIDSLDLRSEQERRYLPAPCANCGQLREDHWSIARICPVAPHLTVYKEKR